MELLTPGSYFRMNILDFLEYRHNALPDNKLELG